ncbi:AI-2E family transporter [Sinorhizobium numidicum]|uniref:AI-2E family transporter n=1 Tax=Sinorhizobium numidicum TaxID=680248 RepID=A0ABY8CR33_9HYPH|nr:AI-2E family transporter [Sinorhizobium numidicum]WEX73907.1 AI-2E family transporter [Sinorhizobium numidicum]WEX79892.1 AI-2E family transporter [Sinorhizobium numidicum]
MAKNVSARAATDAPDQLLTPRRSRSFVLLAAIVAGIVVCYLLAVPFLPALAWALVLAVMFHPLHQQIEKRVRYPEIVAAITVASAVFVVAVPVLFIAERLVGEAAKGARSVEEMLRSGSWAETLAAHPRIAPIVNWIETQLDVAGIAGNAATWLTNVSASFVRGSVAQVIDLVLTFYFLFYFLRDGRQALDTIKGFSPLTSVEMNRLFGRVSDTVQAIVFGTVAVAVIQGTLGGLIFWFLGMPTPLLWGLIMGLLAIVPVLGAFVIWIPAALSLALSGEWGRALILIVWGAGVVATVDNLLYPILVGNRLKLHSLAAFMSMIGGIVVFGPAGLVIGPVAFTVTLLLLEIWRERHPEGST